MPACLQDEYEQTTFEMNELEMSLFEIGLQGCNSRFCWTWFFSVSETPFGHRFTRLPDALYWNWPTQLSVNLGSSDPYVNQDSTKYRAICEGTFPKLIKNHKENLNILSMGRKFSLLFVLYISILQSSFLSHELWQLKYWQYSLRMSPIN